MHLPSPAVSTAAAFYRLTVAILLRLILTIAVAGKFKACGNSYLISSHSA